MEKQAHAGKERRQAGKYIDKKTKKGTEAGQQQESRDRHAERQASRDTKGTHIKYR
jgi:hypothetical protein